MTAPSDPLDAGRILAAAGGAANRWRVELLDQIDSTNAELLRRPIDEAHRLALLADRQTAGRGRRGRSWHSPGGGNLYLSLGWKGPAAPMLALVLAIAVARALEREGLHGHGIKWPNDLWVKDRKLGGCLVESRHAATKETVSVLGIGLNVRMPDAGDAIDQPWAQLADPLPDVTRNDIAGALIQAVDEAMGQWQTEGAAPFLADWPRFDLLAGRSVHLSGPQDEWSGIARGISTTGALRVEHDGRVTEHLVGDVSVRPR